MKTIEPGMRFEREMRFDARELSADSRTVPATLSSTTPVKRWFGMETLSHEPGAADLSRAGLVDMFRVAIERCRTDAKVGKLVPSKLPTMVKACERIARELALEGMK
jgi:hypothetical protein